jgi:rhamnulose-1-phosphate aldolase
MANISKIPGFSKLLDDIKRISGLVRNKGWSESNAGNISVNITDLLINSRIPMPEINSVKLNKSYKHLGSCYILITSSGSRMRDISENPIPGLCILYIKDSGSAYYNIPIDRNKVKIPSSELFTHLEIQNRLTEKKAAEKVVLHTHPDEIIALTHIKQFRTEKKINKLISVIQPEVPAILPEGTGFVPYIIAGSEKLAKETSKKFKKHKIVIWEKHGCISIGKDINDAFDKTEIVNKSIKIFFLCYSSGNKPEGLNVYQVKELNKLNKK